MGKNETMHIVSCADDNYARHLGGMFASLLMNMDKTRNAKLYVIDGGITAENKDKLEQTAMSFGTPLEFLEVDADQYKHAVESSHITKAAYYRISIPDLIKDESVKRMIYIDCDAIVMEDISVLWDLDISPAIVAAVEDAGQHERLKKMNISDTAKYFNSGIMIIDFEPWRKQNISKKVIDFINDNSSEDFLVFHDQDALNAILYDQWHELHPRWNAQTHIIMNEKTPPELIDRIRYRETRAEPAIVHFCGGDKPWNTGTSHPYRDHYFRYMSFTKWNTIDRPAMNQ
ncbi:general stress protein A [Bacillus amyloliquefaciens]|nr:MULTISPECIES: glycosyltransferase family 8 protein [Bacillus]AIU75316.1 general stress protein A [Bacillus subtilis]UXZ17773.1 glycosyltransferase family 8 protein [Bacillus siamensis]COD26313.1 lipopolysaccharide biosynthesis proteins%2C LPS:glycosyltransferases [Streptococcus pneumoniae]AGF25756.1 General stress protein A [Bacillus amyloliquefaciens IT-45]AHC44115.1 general stress protein A [Bacillus amyloliquefaciens LFB112]